MQDELVFKMAEMEAIYYSMAESIHPSKVRLYDPLRATTVDEPKVTPPLVPRPCRF